MITQEQLKSKLSYDQQTGEFTWISGNWKGYRAGGRIQKNGRRRLIVFGKCYLEHRLVYLYVLGEMPFQIDHINGDQSDNKWCNLRLADHTTNRRNMKLFHNNTSGETGVWKARNNKWQAHITVNYKQINLGYFDDIVNAALARKNAELKYFGDFAPHLGVQKKVLG